MRHPMYVGLLALSLAYVLYIGSLNALAIFLGMCVFFRRKAAYEETLLRAKYPEYQQYAERTPAFIPKALRL